MDNRISGDMVWEKLKRSAKFMEMTAELQEAWLPFVTAMPEVLADGFSEPVTLRSLTLTQRQFNQYCLENGLPAKIVQALPADVVSAEGNEEKLQNFIALCFKRVMQLQDQLLQDGNLAELEKQYGKPMFGQPPLQLSGEMAVKYRQGTLTIGDVVASMPDIFIMELGY